MSIETSKHVTIQGIDTDAWKRFRALCVLNNQTTGERINWLINLDLDSQTNDPMRQIRPKSTT